VTAGVAQVDVSALPEIMDAMTTNCASRIIHLQRRPVAGGFSIEALFRSLRDVMSELGYKVLPAVVPYSSKGGWRRLANIWWASRNQGDVNHITGDVHYLAFGLARKKTILTIHDCYPLERFSGLRRWILRVLWFDLPARRSALVTVISEETKRQLLRHVRVPADKIIVVPNAVAAIYRPAPKPFNAIRPRILHIGAAPNKNLERLIQAVKGTECHLTVVGSLSAQQRRELEDSAISYDLRADLDHMAMYRTYCESDIVSFVSTYEGFGMPIVEAQWVERPVVTSNCSSMPEVAGNGACFVDPFDVNSIRRGLERVIADGEYRKHLIEEGRKNRERYSLLEVAQLYLSLYDRLSQC
jgi:glycosyltransferase involved in cell wall biosynthesis